MHYPVSMNGYQEWFYGWVDGVSTHGMYSLVYKCTSTYTVLFSYRYFFNMDIIYFELWQRDVEFNVFGGHKTTDICMRPYTYRLLYIHGKKWFD